MRQDFSNKNSKRRQHKETLKTVEQSRKVDGNRQSNLSRIAKVAKASQVEL